MSCASPLLRASCPALKKWGAKEKKGKITVVCMYTFQFPGVVLSRKQGGEYNKTVKKTKTTSSAVIHGHWMPSSSSSSVKIVYSAVAQHFRYYKPKNQNQNSRSSLSSGWYELHYIIKNPLGRDVKSAHGMRNSFFLHQLSVLLGSSFYSVTHPLYGMWL